MGYVKDISCWISGVQSDPRGKSDCEPGDFAEVSYDLDKIRQEVDRDRLASGPATMWRYADLLPLDDASKAVSLGEGFTPLLPSVGLGAELGLCRLYLKDEGHNPSGTFKDRGTSASVSRLRELGVTTVVHNSSGNAGGSWGMYSARAGIKCVNLLPDDVLPASLQQSSLSGSKTYVLNDHWKHSGPMVGKAVAANGWCDVRTLKEPYRLEGKRTMGFEIAEQLGWTLPDAVIYPTGGGLGAIAIFKAFRELMELGWVEEQPLPKLIVTQYEGCAPIAKAYREGANHADLWEDLDVLPGGLKSTRPPGDVRVLKLLEETNGLAVTVSTEQAIEAVRQIISTEGIFTCPESATTLVGLRHAIANDVISTDDKVVAMLTGNGLKSIPVLPDAIAEYVTSQDALT